MTRQKTQESRLFVVTLGAALGAALLAWGGVPRVRAQAAPTMDTAPHGTITPWAAMKIANKKIQGKAIEANYGFEDGHWLYDVIIIKNGKLNEVEVNALTGAAAAAETVTPEDEGKETTDDLNTALGKKASSAGG